MTMVDNENLRETILDEINNAPYMRSTGRTRKVAACGMFQAHIT